MKVKVNETDGNIAGKRENVFFFFSAIHLFPTKTFILWDFCKELSR